MQGVWSGIIICAFSALVFGALRVPDLPTHFQWDGQLAEYLAWSKAPENFSGTLNAELNPRLFSIYYPILAYLHQFIDRLPLLTGVYLSELVLLSVATFLCGWMLVRDVLVATLLSMAILWGNALSATLGGGGGVGLVCNPEYPATAMILIGLGLSFTGRHRRAIVVCAAAFNLHGSLAIFGAGMVYGAAVLALGGTRQWRRLLLVTVLGLAAAVPTAYWALSNLPPSGSVAASVTWWKFPRWIYPLHIYVSMSPGHLWLTFAGLVLPAIVGWRALRIEFAAKHSILLGWSIAAVVLLTLGYVLVEWYPVRFIAQLTLWRGTRFVLVIAMALGLFWLRRQLQQGAVRALLAALAMMCMIGLNVPFIATAGWVSFALLAGAPTTKQSTFAKILSTLAIGLFCALAWRSMWQAALPVGLVLRIAVLVGAIGIVMMWSVKVEARSRPIAAALAVLIGFSYLNAWHLTPALYGPKARRALSLAQLAPAVQCHSRPGELIVAAPDVRNPGAWAARGSFLCRQQLTAYAYGPWLVPDLLERMRCFGGDGNFEESFSLQRLIKQYHAAPPAVFDALHRHHGVRLAITDQSRRLPFRCVAMNDVFLVYDLAAEE